VQRAIILLVALVVAGGAYYVMQQHEADTPEQLNGDHEKSPSKKSDGDAGLNPLKGKDALPAPDPVVKDLKSPAQALMIGTHQDPWNQLVLMAFGSLKELSYRSWFVHDPSGEGSGVAGPARGMTELKDKPTASYLDAEDVTLLVLDNLDPNALPMDFWSTVRERVESGRMGLFVRPGYPATPEGQGLSVHPLLSHPIVKDLLPVKTAMLLSGTPIPGVYAEPQTLRATKAGNEHPATRLISVPEVSVKVWSGATTGDGGFATKFCYPVEETKDGTEVLVQCEAAATLPAVIATPATSRSRVLWMGSVDFGWRTYYVREKDALQKILLNHMIVWLLGQS